jgi:hypothetical protein
LPDVARIADNERSGWMMASWRRAHRSSKTLDDLKGLKHEIMPKVEVT